MEQDNSFVHSTLDGGEDIYITDQWKRKYHFRIASFPAPTGLAFEAYEGWRFKFQILDTYDDEK